MPKYKDVNRAFRGVPNSHISKVDSDGLYAQVTVSEKQAGRFFQTLRTNDFDFDAKRLGSNLVAHIEVEEPEGLGQLFG